MKLCKKANLKYAVFVRDPTHCWFHRGLKAGVDPNSGFETVIDTLAAEVDLLKPRELVMMGASMGGYAAIRAGLQLKATSVIAFSPQVLLGTAERASAMILPMPTLDPYLLKLHLAAELEGFRVKTLITAVEQSPGYDTLIQVSRPGRVHGPSPAAPRRAAPTIRGPHAHPNERDPPICHHTPHLRGHAARCRRRVRRPAAADSHG